MLDSPMLVDQNMVCGSNTDQRDHFARLHLHVSLIPGIHQIFIPTFPFDQPTHQYESPPYCIIPCNILQYLPAIL